MGFRTIIVAIIGTMLAFGCGGVPDHRVFVGSAVESALYVVDPETGEVVDSLAIPFEPTCLLASPDDGRLYVAGRGGAAVVDADTFQVRARAEFSATAVSLSTTDERATLVVGLDNGRALGLRSDNLSTVWTKSVGSGEVAVCDSDHGVVLASSDGVVTGIGSTKLESCPADVEWYADERMLLFVCADSTLVALSHPTMEQEARIHLPGQGGLIVPTPSGRTFVLGGGGLHVWLAAYASWRRLVGARCTIPGTLLTGLAVSPGGEVVYATTDEGLFAVEASWMKRTGSLTREGGFAGVATLPPG
jgi:DNA-binding beta-propeller fold protein YncE